MLASAARIEVTQTRLRDYTVVVMLEEATDGGLVYRAEIPALAGCMSHGESPEEALQNLSEALDLYLDVAETLTAPPYPQALRPTTTTTGTAGDGESPWAKPLRQVIELVRVA